MLEIGVELKTILVPTNRYALERENLQVWTVTREEGIPEGHLEFFQGREEWRAFKDDVVLELAHGTVCALDV